MSEERDVFVMNVWKTAVGYCVGRKTVTVENGFEGAPVVGRGQTIASSGGERPIGIYRRPGQKFALKFEG